MIKSQLAAYAKRGTQTAAAVRADCIRHGYLTRRYGPKTLRSARRSLPIDVEDYTACPYAIRSQLAVIAGKG